MLLTLRRVSRRGVDRAGCRGCYLPGWQKDATRGRTDGKDRLHARRESHGRRAGDAGRECVRPRRESGRTTQRLGATDKPGVRTTDGPTPSVQRPDADPVDPESYPLAFDAENKTVFPEKPVYDSELVGARLITMTLDQLRARALPTSRSTWQMAPIGLFVDVETLDEQLYALDLRVEEGTGTRAGRLAMTLSRISPATGTVLDEVAWQKTQDVQSSGDPVVRIASIRDDIVLVESGGSDEGSRRTVTAVDVASGEELWTRRPGSFVADADDAVVLSTAAGSEPGSLIAVDLESGAVQVGRTARHPRGRPVGVLDGHPQARGQLRRQRGVPSCVAVDTTDGSVSRGERRQASGLGVATRPRTRSSCAPCRGSALWASTSRPAKRSGTAHSRPVRRLGQLGARELRVRLHVGRSVRRPGRRGPGRDVTETAGAAPVSSNGYGGMIFYSGQAIFYPADPERTEPVSVGVGLALMAQQAGRPGHRRRSRPSPTRLRRTTAAGPSRRSRSEAGGSARSNRARLPVRPRKRLRRLVSVSTSIASVTPTEENASCTRKRAAGRQPAGPPQVAQARHHVVLAVDVHEADVLVPPGEDVECWCSSSSVTASVTSAAARLCRNGAAVSGRRSASRRGTGRSPPLVGRRGQDDGRATEVAADLHDRAAGRAASACSTRAWPRSASRRSSAACSTPRRRLGQSSRLRRRAGSLCHGRAAAQHRVTA